MFDHLEIRNFKSVEHVELNCRRVNVLIGEPNTGKSNILEALGLISYVGYFNSPTDLQSFVRCDEVSNLFYDGDLSREIEITLGREEPFGNEYQRQRGTAFNCSSRKEYSSAALRMDGRPGIRRVGLRRLIRQTSEHTRYRETTSP